MTDAPSATPSAETTLEDFAFDHASHVVDHHHMVAKPFHALAHHLADLVHKDHLGEVLAWLKAARDAALAHPAAEEVSAPAADSETPAT